MSMAICSSCDGYVDTDEDPAACAEDKFLCEICREDIRSDDKCHRDETDEEWSRRQAAINKRNAKGHVCLFNELRGAK